jgi:hypothetical protein
MKWAVDLRCLRERYFRNKVTIRFVFDFLEKDSLLVMLF